MNKITVTYVREHKPQIHYIVGQQHVSLTDAELETLLRSKANPDRYTERAIAELVKIGLKFHHDNQKFFKKNRF